MESGSSYIRGWHALLAMFFAGLAVTAYIQFSVLGDGLSDRSLGKAVGGALFYVALPALVIVPWRWAQKRTQPTNGPIIAGVVVFLIVAALSLTGTVHQ